MRVVIVGASSSLGGCLARTLGARFELLSPRPRQAFRSDGLGAISWLQTRLDVHAPETCRRLLAEARADAVVNCVAVTPSSPEAQDPAACRQVNSVLPHALAEAAVATGTYLIHLSTDGVFSGRRGNYRETDPPDATDLYGQSKSRGEVVRPGCLTLRTSFFGVFPTQRGLLNWFLTRRGSSAAGYTNYMFSGLSAPGLARVIGDLIARPARISGLRHLGGEPTSKWALLARFRELCQLDIELRTEELPQAIDRSLDAAHLWEDLGRPRPTLQESLAEVLADFRAAAKMAGS